MAATFEKANTYVFAASIVRDREVGGSNPLAPIVPDAQSHRFDRRPLCSIRCVSVAPRRLRIRMSHQIGNRRFTATRFRKSGPERVTQIVPMQVFNPR
jgi:hypothetical protein